MPKKDVTPLKEGIYGDKKSPGLQITRYIGSNETKTAGTTQHAFLVHAISGEPGGAFLRFNLREAWLNKGALSLEFNDPTIADELERKRAEKTLYDEAVTRVVAANVPAEEAEKQAETEYKNALTAARISIGTVYRLQDWDDGTPHDVGDFLGNLEGCQFSGHVSQRTYQGKVGAEVDSVTPCRRV
jgi:hypothetical protein